MEPVPTYKTLAEDMAELTWLWPGWLPFGNLSVLFAAKGAGKTHVALELGLRLIQGLKTWPDGAEAPEGVKVAYLDTEGRKPMIRQRAETAGVDLDQIIYPFRDTKRSPRLDSGEDWAQFVECVKDSGARFVVVDSLLRAFMGDENNSREVGELLGRLQDLATRLNICVLVVHHQRKKPDMFLSSAVTLDQARGSGAITQYAASVLVIEPTKVPEVSRLRVERANLVEPPEGVGFTIDEMGLHWCEVPGEEKTRNLREEAKTFLLKALAEGPVYSTELFEMAERAGIKSKTLRRARGLLPIKIRPETGQGRWTWSLARNGS